MAPKSARLEKGKSAKNKPSAPSPSKRHTSTSSRGNTSKATGCSYLTHSLPWFFRVKLKSPNFTNRLHLLEIAADIFRHQDATVKLKIGYAKGDFETSVKFEYRKIPSSGRVICRFKAGWVFIAEELKLNQGDTVTFSRDPTHPSLLHVSVKHPGEMPEIIEVKEDDDSDFDFPLSDW